VDGNGTTDTRVAPAIDAPPPSGPPGTPAPDPLAAAAAGPGEKGRLRRRLRRLKRSRERHFADLGTLVVDARKRSNGSRPDVVDRRAAEAAEVDRQVRELGYAVDAEANPRVLATGVSGSCAGCGNLLGTEDRFCPQCGTPTKAGRTRPEDISPVEPRRPGADAPAAGAPTAPPMPGAPEAVPMGGTSTAGPPPPSPDAPYAAVDPSKLPPPPPAADTGYAKADPSKIPPPPPPAA